VRTVQFGEWNRYEAGGMLGADASMAPGPEYSDPTASDRSKQAACAPQTPPRARCQYIVNLVSNRRYRPD
jgi:hypothetical protein